MNTFQMVVVGLGGLLGVSVFWDKIKTFIPTFKKKDVDPDDKDPVPHHDLVEGSLADIVACWDNLHDEMKKRGLNKAAAELTKIFPLLIQKTEEAKKDKE